MSTTIETDLKEILGRIDQRLDRIETDLTDIKIDVATIKVEMTTLKEDVKDLKSRTNAQIWTLIISIVGALAAGVIKFGFFPNP